MSLQVDKNTMQIMMNSVGGGASAYFLTSVPVAGGVIFGVTCRVASGIGDAVLKGGGSQMQKVMMKVVAIFASIAAAWAVTSLLIGILSLKTTAVLSGGIFVTNVVIESIVKKLAPHPIKWF